MTSARSSSSLQRVLVGGPPGRRTGAAQIEPAHGEATLGAQPQVVVGVRLAGQVVLAIRQRLEQRAAPVRTGAGRYRSAASRVPSRTVIHTCSHCTDGVCARAAAGCSRGW